MANRAEKAKADGLIICPPYYWKPSEESILAHFRAIAEAIGRLAPIPAAPVAAAGVPAAPEPDIPEPSPPEPEDSVVETPDTLVADAPLQGKSDA